MNAISLRGVAKTFSSGTMALAPADLDIAGGSFVAIVGPSGCGKSTLLRMIAGLAEPTAGHVERAEGAIGFVFQSPTLMPWATARENCALPLTLAGGAGETGDALARVGLAGFEDSYPHELSGGMQMRVSIARAMVTKPRLLLMDEPFAALDELTRFKLNDDLLALWKQNRWTVVFVTHSIREAVFLAERVVVLSPRPGRVVAEIAVALPDRSPGARLSHAFADQCARVAAALEGAA